MNKEIKQKRRQTATRLFVLFAAALFIALPLFATPALAAEGGGDWRPVYDTVMLWVNFLILAFVIYYFGRRPLGNFLKGQQDEVSSELKKLEDRKKQFEGQIRETRQMIEESNTRFEKIKTRITEEGRRKRQEIIDGANEQSRKLLEMEKKKAANQIAQARQRLLAELADTASDLAARQLPSEMTEADQENMLSLYISQITAYSQQTAS